MIHPGRPAGRWCIPPLVPGILVLLCAGFLQRPRDIAPVRHVVEIRGMAFHPAELEIGRGDTVVWINRDIVPHTATGSGKPGWSTGTLVQDQSGQYVPHHRGTTSYFCVLHPVMKGKLIIR
jgi:plastocyanin